MRDKGLHGFGNLHIVCSVMLVIIEITEIIDLSQSFLFPFACQLKLATYFGPIQNRRGIFCNPSSAMKDLRG
jgi:hypothetical protein